MVTFAGRYDEPMLRRVNGRLGVATGTTVRVYESDGSTVATLYTGRTKAVVADNPVAVDASGNLEFFADPGTYVLSILESGGEVATNTIVVHADPAEPAGVGAHDHDADYSGTAHTHVTVDSVNSLTGDVVLTAASVGADPAGSAAAAQTASFAYTDAATATQAAVGIAVTDETTTLATGTAKVTFRMPYGMELDEVRASLNVASSSGTPTIDINDGGVSILSTKITVDVSEKTSTTAAVPPVLSDTTLSDDAEITIDIDVAGTGAKGLKVWLIGTAGV